MKALVEQAERLTLSSRAFFNDKFPVFAAQLTSMFGYDMALPMNTGAEGVETAIKLARKWGYEKKKIPKNEVRVPKLLIVFIFYFIAGKLVSDFGIILCVYVAVCYWKRFYVPAGMV